MRNLETDARLRTLLAGTLALGLLGALGGCGGSGATKGNVAGGSGGAVGSGTGGSAGARDAAVDHASAADAGDAGAPRTQAVYMTFYGWPDNSPPGDAIAYAKSDGFPTVHNGAGGTGNPTPIRSPSRPIRRSSRWGRCSMRRCSRSIS